MAQNLASIGGVVGRSTLCLPATTSSSSASCPSAHALGNCCSVARESGSAPFLAVVRVRCDRQRALGRIARSGNGSCSRIRFVATACPRDEAVSQPSTLTEYHDSSLEVTAIEFLTSRIGYVSGKKTKLKGYDGFVDITRKLVHGLPSQEQRATVKNLFDVLIPRWAPYCFRLVPRTTFVTEVYARVTSIFFKWLVGDTEIREAEVKGVMMRSTVHVKKCRYLEHSQCIGMCVNLCKTPTQDFIGKQLGMPLTMIPNFEDLSCDMIYGMHPPPIEEDEAFRQPCLSKCSSAKQDVKCA